MAKKENIRKTAKRKTSTKRKTTSKKNVFIEPNIFGGLELKSGTEKVSLDENDAAHTKPTPPRIRNK